MSQLGQMIYEDGLKKGVEKGQLEGKLEGKREGKLEAAKALLDILSDEAIAKRLELPMEQVKKLRQES